MNKFCILSTDNNPDYYTLLPLVCHSWRKIGFTPVIYTVGVPENIQQILFEYCKPCSIFEMPSFEGVKDSTIAQMKRLFVTGCPDDAVLLTADADMVIGRDIFTHDVSQGQIVSYGFDLTGRSELPICYVKATAAKWRELMGEFTIPDKSYSDKWEDYWSVDQQLLTQRACEYGMDKITFVDRGNQNKHGLPTGRWDRHDWAHIPDSIIDVHMKRGDWDAQYQVAERLWPGEDHSFITKFREALEGYEITEESKEVKIKMDGVEIKALAVDTEAIDKLMAATKDIAEAYNYPAQILESTQSVSSKRIGAQAELIFLEESDKLGFLMGVTGNWNNHLPLLLLGLHLTNGAVMEMGSGDGSTPLLRKYCEATGRTFQTFDNNEEWCKKTGADYVQTDLWGALVAGAAGAHRGLIFIDHAPGERRHLDAIRLANAADILVLHDTEEGGAGNYMWEKAWPHFKYRLNYNKTGGGAGATMVSNKIDVNKFRGLTLGKYTFDND